MSYWPQLEETHEAADDIELVVNMFKLCIFILAASIIGNIYCLFSGLPIGSLKLRLGLTDSGEVIILLTDVQFQHARVDEHNLIIWSIWTKKLSKKHFLFCT